MKWLRAHHGSFSTRRSQQSKRVLFAIAVMEEKRHDPPRLLRLPTKFFGTRPFSWKRLSFPCCCRVTIKFDKGCFYSRHNGLFQQFVCTLRVMPTCQVVSARHSRRLFINVGGLPEHVFCFGFNLFSSSENYFHKTFTFKAHLTAQCSYKDML